MKKKYIAFKLAKVFSTHFANQRKAAFTLAEVFSTHFANHRKAAFTLAEVFSTHFANHRKAAFTLAEVFSTHFAGQRKAAFTLAKVFSTHFAGHRKAAFTLAEVFSTHFANHRKAAFTLAEVFSTHFANQRKAAFTLAEVLITLGIIGVVAAMTLPSVISKYKKHVVANQVKKFYTNFNQAIKLSEVENGDFKYWSYSNSDELYDNYLAKYLKVVQVQRNIHMYGNFTQGIKLIFSDGSQVICSPATNLAAYGNGALINPCIFYTKGTGKWESSATEAGYSTHDVFWFLINSNGILEPPYLHKNYSRSKIIELCKKIDYTGNGMTACGTLLYLDNWEIKDDYPW